MPGDGSESLARLKIVLRCTLAAHFDPHLLDKLEGDAAVDRRLLSEVRDLLERLEDTPDKFELVPAE
jgi:hypothetical protein